MFSKLFSRKDEKTGQINAGESKFQASVPEASTAGQEIHNLAAQEFGLMFSFENGKSQTFTSLPILIGREDQNTLILQDPSVSSQHACVYFDERLQKVCIADLDSINGLFINDRPTRRNILQDDARIKIGNLTLTFRDTGYIHSGS